MDAYRDQYAQLFHGGTDVALVAISTDPDTTLAAWAKERGYPFTFVSDPDGAIGKAYGAFNERFGLDNRTLYVLRDGKVAYVAAPFREVDPQAYRDLGAAITRTLGPK